MAQSLQPHQFPEHGLATGLAPLRDMAPWIIGFGLLLVAFGALAFASVLTATIITVYFVGIGMIAAGLAEIIIGIQAKSWSRFLFWVILGAVYTLAGAFTFANPLLAADLLTLVLGISLITTGLLRIFLAFQMRAGQAWLWIALSGVITTALGVMIVQQWPVSTLYILGVFLSIDLLFSGFGWIYFGAMLLRHQHGTRTQAQT